MAALYNFKFCNPAVFKFGSSRLARPIGELSQ